MAPGDPPAADAQRNGAGNTAPTARSGAPPLTPLRERRCSSCDDTGEVQTWSDITAGRYDRLRTCPTCGGASAAGDPPDRFFGLPYRYADLAAFSFERFDCTANAPADPAVAADHPADPAERVAALQRNLEGALREAQRWSEGGRDWLVLFGPSPGCGKTHLAAAALHERIARHGERGAFVDVPLLIEALRPNGRGGDAHALRERLRNVDTLLLDNLGGEYQTGWTASELALLLRERHRQQLATAVTCAREPADPALLSVLVDQQRSMVYRITGGDYRTIVAERPG